MALPEGRAGGGQLGSASLEADCEEAQLVRRQEALGQGAAVWVKVRCGRH